MKSETIRPNVRDDEPRWPMNRLILQHITLTMLPNRPSFSFITFVAKKRETKKKRREWGFGVNAQSGVMQKVDLLVN